MVHQASTERLWGFDEEAEDDDDAIQEVDSIREENSQLLQRIESTDEQAVTKYIRGQFKSYKMFVFFSSVTPDQVFFGRAAERGRQREGRV